MTNPSGLLALSGAIETTITTADILVSNHTELAIDVNVTAISGTSASYQLIVNRKGMDGVYYTIYKGTAVTANGQISLSLGRGMAQNVSFGKEIQIQEVLAGTNPSVTRSISVIGK